MINYAQEVQPDQPIQDLATKIERPTRALPRRRFFDDMPDKGLFAFVTILGFAVVVAMKLHDYNPDFVAAVAVALMLGYGVIAYRIPAVQLRLDRLGDNFYYLGFMFTLASMSAALLQLRGGASVEALLGSFGIALFTTIVGVAGRVLFVQMRSEIDEVEAEVRRDLLATANELKGQLSLALREFETFSTAARQTAEESLKLSAEAARAQLDAIGGAARAAAHEIQSAFGANAANAKQIGQTVVETSRVVETMAERMASLELPTKRLDQQVLSFGTGLESVVSKLAHAIDEAAQFRTGRRRRRWYWPFNRAGQ